MNEQTKRPAIKSRERIADYVLCHLGEVAANTSEITGDIEEVLTHPHRNPNSEQTLELWRKLARENIEYISQGLCDLREFENTDGVKI
jgi:hypothetical protein